MSFNSWSCNIKYLNNNCFGFSILVLSKFIPTIYFGIFTGLAMLLAMISVLTLLPSLILIVKPFWIIMIDSFRFFKATSGIDIFFLVLLHIYLLFNATKKVLF